MNEFNELKSINQFLVDELILARQTNEQMAENNRRLENLLVKAIQDLKQCQIYLDEIKNQVGELATVALARVKKL
tara:strand:- start:1214 stop:1438 length:225 start_codon:yes stop_codon:yes gene_type:complete